MSGEELKRTLLGQNSEWLAENGKIDRNSEMKFFLLVHAMTYQLIVQDKILFFNLF